MGRGGRMEQHSGQISHNIKQMMGMNNNDSRSQDRSVEEKPKMNQLPGVAGGKKKMQSKPDPKRGQDEQGKMDGSDNGDSQNDSQGRPGGPYYDFNYGMQPHPYSYNAGYNYQMPPHSMGHNYNLYPNHHPMGYDKMGQRPVPKQYGYSSGYNYQDRAYPQGGMNAMRNTPGHHDYYDGYNYEEGEIGQIRGQMQPQMASNIQNKSGGDYARQDKGRKPATADRQPGFPYHYGQPIGNPMYPNVHMGGHYDSRTAPYEYNEYKHKAGESGIAPQQQAPYNYKSPNSQPPYSYGNSYKNNDLGHEAQDQEMKHVFREDANKQKKAPPQAAKGRPEDAKDLKAAGANKTPKARQFAEDADKK